MRTALFSILLIAVVAFGKIGNGRSTSGGVLEMLIVASIVLCVVQDVKEIIKW